MLIPRASRQCVYTHTPAQASKQTNKPTYIPPTHSWISAHNQRTKKIIIQQSLHPWFILSGIIIQISCYNLGIKEITEITLHGGILDFQENTRIIFLIKKWNILNLTLQHNLFFSREAVYMVTISKKKVWFTIRIAIFFCVVSFFLLPLQMNLYLA